MIGIGIDTGGTYTDAVVYDMGRKKVLCSGKALTTKSELEIGIAAALDLLPVANDKGRAVVCGIPVFFLHLCQKSQRLFLGFHRSGRRNKTGFFFDQLSFSAFI